MNAMSKNGDRVSRETYRSRHNWIEVYNAGASLPVVFLHGYPLDGSMWVHQIESLRQYFTVIAIDLRGFGESPAVAEITTDNEPLSDEYTLASLADDCVEALEFCGVHGPVVICGLSMGGYIAFEIWHRHPSRVKAMILCDTRAAADTPEAAAARIAIAERVFVEGTAAVVSPMLPRLFAASTFQRMPEIIERIVTMMGKVPRRTIALAQRAMATRSDFTRLLEKIEVPVLVVVGESDAISSPGEMQGLAARIPNATFKIIENAGHLPPLENPEAFNQTIKSFLTGLNG